MLKRLDAWLSARLYAIALAAAVCFFIVNSSGFVDTITQSTSGCGESWPLCHGSIMPWNWDYHAWIEFGHRFLVFSATVLLTVLSVSAWRTFGRFRPIRWTIAGSIFGVVGESALGAMSVFHLNAPLLMAAHLGIALITFGSLTVMTVTIRRLQRAPGNGAEPPAVRPVDRRTARLSLFAFVFLYLAVYFGAYVASTGSGGFFQGFPLPTESFAFAGKALWIDIGHRLFAAGLLVLTLLLIARTRKSRAERPDMHKAAWLSFLLVCLQGASGYLLIATYLSMGAVLLHVSIISLLFADICYMAVQSLPQGRARTSDSESANASRRIEALS